MVKTFLGAHALPPEFAGRANDYIALVCNDMMPILAREGLIDAVDVFCENIGFTREQTRRVFETAKSHRLRVKAARGAALEHAGRRSSPRSSMRCPPITWSTPTKRR